MDHNCKDLSADAALFGIVVLSAKIWFAASDGGLHWARRAVLAAPGALCPDNSDDRKRAGAGGQRVAAHRLQTGFRLGVFGSRSG
jgi:hypothetical protein